MSVCSRIIRLMNNQTKSQKRATPFTNKRESDDKNAVAIVKIVPQLSCVLQDSEALVSQRGKQASEKPVAKSLGTDSESTIHSVYATSSKYPGKEGTIAWKIQVKNPHQRTPYAMKYEDQSLEETERQHRYARSRAWNFAENIYELQENDKATVYSPAEEWVLLAASTKEQEEREFVVDSGASKHMVNKRDLNSAELETMRTSRSPTTVMTANAEVQTREEAAVLVKGIGLIRDSYAS